MYQSQNLPQKKGTVRLVRSVIKLLMSNEDAAFKKTVLPFEYLKDADRQDSLLEELKDVAFEVLILHYGVDKKGWINILCSQYKTEVVDVFGPDDCAARDGLSELWTTTYNDRYSGISRTFEEWSKAFVTERDVRNYYEQNKK